jgi:hypothetical protein
MATMEVRSWITGCRAVGLPFTDFCEPLLFGDLEIDEAVKILRQQGLNRGWKYLELRGGDAVPGSCRAGAQFYAHTVDLRAPAETLFARCASSVRRAIRKARKNGLTAEVSRKREALVDFYHLHTRTRRRHGLPPQPFSFFQNIFEEIISHGLGFIVSVRVAAQPAAAAVFFRYAKRAVFKFGASDQRHQELRVNNLTMWEGIERLAADGCEELDLGRTAVESQALRRFKAGWAAKERVVSYEVCDMIESGEAAARHMTSGAHTVLFRRLPLCVNRFLGGMVYPHLD